MRFRKVFTICAFSFKEVRNSVEAKSINTHVAPIVDDPEDLFLDEGVVIVQIGLVVKKAVPVILLGNRVPGPVRSFKILEDDAHVAVLVRIIRPHIKIPFG